jgi:DNA helicase IV
MNIESETGYLEHVKKNILLKRDELKSSSSSTNLVAADNKSGINLREHFESKILPDPKSPYFTRVDLASGEIVYYGHVALSPSRNSPPLPLSHSLVSYFLTYSRNSDEKGWSVHPISVFGGDILRRVRFEIREGQLVNLKEELLEEKQDSVGEILASDQLETAMKQTREEKLRPVGSTLQPDQFDLIRERSDQILAIQGPPGSGKTVVLLERMSRIAFSDKSVRDNGMLLVGPNSHFLEYVSDAMEILGNPEIITSTVEELTKWRIDSSPDIDEIQIIKGSRKFERIIDNCVYDLSQTINEAFIFQVGALQCEFYPLDSYLILKNIADSDTSYLLVKERATGQIINILTQRILEKIRDSGTTVSRFTDDPGQIIQKTNEFKRLIRTMFPEVTPDLLLKRIKYSSNHFTKYSKNILDEDEVIKWMKHVVPESPCIRLSDIPLLDYLDYKLNGRESSAWGHIAVDEVQDLTPMQVGVLRRRIGGNGTFSLSGDLVQATGPAHYASWPDIVNNFESGKAFLQRELTTSYRVPKEILEYASKFLEKSEVHVKTVKPFLLIENALSLENFSSIGEIKRRIDDIITQGLMEGQSVLLISTQEINSEYSKLNFDSVGNAHFKSFRPLDVKGFEFDVVIIVNPFDILEELDMPLGRLARLFYVLTTRSTKKLFILGKNSREVEDPIDFFLHNREKQRDFLTTLN